MMTRAGPVTGSPTTLVDLLANSIVLRQIAPLIAVRDLLRLSATDRSLRAIIYGQSDTWRHLSLTQVKSAIVDSSPIDVGGVSWRAERMDEALTEDEFYAGPLRGIFGRLHSKELLKFVQTMILDGLSVPADLVREIVAEDRFNVRMLSIREVKNLNHGKLQQVLRYIVRPTRTDNNPRLKALYVFGSKDGLARIAVEPSIGATTSDQGVTVSEGAQIGAAWNQRSSTALTTRLADEETKWYASTGRALKRQQSEWPETLQVCKDLIVFDAVLCRGKRHDITKVDSKNFLQPTIATIALGPSGCESCGSCPEGPATFGQCEDAALPLLGPPPLHASTVRAGQRPSQLRDGSFPKLILRCEDCLRGRWCERCNRWWCEDCYDEPVSRLLHPQDQQHATPVEPGNNAGPVKVYSKLCVEHCLVREMMSGAGSNGMWG